MEKGIRYRGRAHVKFKSGRCIDVDRVVRADSFESAQAQLAILFDNYYKNNEFVEYYRTELPWFDTTKKPTLDELKEQILIINNLENVQKMREEAGYKLYEICRTYNPDFDDDTLSDVLSYAKDGCLNECGDLDRMVEYILEDLN